MNNVIFLVFRRMRTPFLVLVGAYALSIAGLVLIPGTDDQGNPWHFDFFHAFYVVSYMGSTIGFGEIPYPFSVAQRMWTTLAIYITVVAWLYAIGSILALIQDSAFRFAVTEQRFRRQVRQIRVPFYLICGYGETGALLVEALCRRGIQSVVIEKDPDRVNQLVLEGLGLHIPALCGDAQLVKHLTEAGLKNSHCMGVLALTDNDDVNLKIAIASKLLNSSLTVIARAETRDASVNMASFNTDHVINPFDIFANRLTIALHTPSAHLLYEWLISMANQPLRTPLNPPRGTWILAGFGRFGKTVERYLEYEGIPSVIIERHPEVAPKGAVIGLGTEAVTLREAGIQKAVGIIAGTHWDAHNLSMVMNARELNPKLYLIARQNEQSTTELFKAANLDWIMEASEMIVRHILPMLTVPLLHRFMQRLRHHHEAWAAALVDRIRGICGGVTPEVWSVVISPEQTPAVHDALLQGRSLCFAHLLRDPQDHTQSMPCLILMATREGRETREGHEILLPNENEPLAIGDMLLFCGHHQYTTRMAWTLNNANVLSYVETGEAPVNSYVWRWFHSRRE